MPSVTALFVLAQIAATDPSRAAADVAPGARNPAYSRDGRLALALRGDLWVQERPGGDARWLRVTSGPAWDREPAWERDGRSLIFSSDRAGAFNLWRVRVGPAGAEGEPERLTASPEPDGEPSVGPTGRIVFVRGRGMTRRLWVREQNAAERRLTAAAGAEHSPAISPDGSRLAYVADLESGRRLRVRELTAGRDSVRDSVIVADRAAEHPAWSPGGDRLAFTVGGFRPGVYVAAADGRYVNLIAAKYAEPAWSPDGARLALAELLPGDVRYNGDPDRVGDREPGELVPHGGRLWFVSAPAPPDAGLAAAHTPTVADRTASNAEAFDRAWSRTASVYYAGAGAADRRARWEALRTKYRPRALAATTDDAFERVVHEMFSERPPYRDSATGRAAVSSAHPAATAAGLEILRKGGNVVDAAVAVSFVLGVVEPDASGIGGYGQMLIYRPRMPEPVVLEFMSRAPEEATLENASLLRNGRLPEDGPVLANVPGTVAGMHLAWKKYGSRKLAWADLLAPAIRMARDGVVVSDGLATTLAVEREHFAKYEGSRALFFRNGAPLRAGDTLRNPDLAATLEQIAKGGADAFYTGQIAKRIASDLRGNGNAIKPSDLARYYAAERAPVAGSYRGHTIYSSAPPVAGGAGLVARLNLLENFATPRPYTEDAASLHAMLVAWQLVPSTRGRVADPGLWPTTVAAFTSKDSARARWRCFNPSRALTSADLRGDRPACSAQAPERPGARADSAAVPAADTRPSTPHSSGTTSFAIADASGDVVSVTQTLGTWGGNFYVTPGLGFLYNDKLGSYPTDPATYGARLPYARHGSTIAPTIVFTGEGARRHPRLALGAAGNEWITAVIYQTLTGVIDQQLGPQAALELPRFLPLGPAPGERGATVQVEEGLAPGVVRRLEELGYRVHKISLPGELRMGYGAAVLFGDGSVTAAADPRRSGAAGALPRD
ncbi:MAG: gamma-glutamyltransferase [Gemmatimonadaceae bacterium]